MAYHEKHLERKIRRISAALDASAWIGFAIGFIAMMFAAVEVWAGDPYSPITYIGGAIGIVMIVNATLIGRLISK